MVLFLWIYFAVFLFIYFCKFINNNFYQNRIIDVGSEWRTFANDKESTDMTRVGAAEVNKF